MRVYLVCYDISEDDLRRRVGDLLGYHGDRVQRSVFEVRFKDSAVFDSLRTDLEELLEAEPDAKLSFYRLCDRCRTDSSTLLGAPVAQFSTTVIV